MSASLPILSPQAEDILAELVTIIQARTVNPANAHTYPKYKQLHDTLNLEMAGKTYGISLSNQGLGALAHWAMANGLPAITTMVVDESNLSPGDTYFDLFPNARKHPEWMVEQVAVSLKENWERFFTERSFIRLDLPTPSPTDATSPERVETTTYRLLRDTVLARRVKRLHEHKCQIVDCDFRIELPNGQLYAEAHHIQPLGGEHRGLDIQENILCLCPNHHTQLDYGVIPLRIENLRQINGHAIGQEFIEYHNKRIHRTSVGSDR